MSFKLHMSLCHKSYRTDRYEFGRIKKLGNIHIHFWYWLHCKCFGCNGKHSESESKSLALSCSESRPYPNPYPYPFRTRIPIPVAIPNRVAGLCALPLTIHPARSLARRRIHSFCHGCTLSPEVAHNRTAHTQCGTQFQY